MSNEPIQTQEGEEWRDVVGFEGLYSVSSMGRVYSHEGRPPKMLKRHLSAKGYVRAPLSYTKDGIKVRRECTVHRLMGLAFIPNPDNKPQINHKDGVKTNNVLSNLEWVTGSENQIHSFRVLGREIFRGQRSVLAKITDADAKFIKDQIKMGTKQIRLAERFKVHYNTISMIKRGLSWRHID